MLTMVNISKQKLTKLQNEILRLLFVKTGKPLNALRIAQILVVSQPAVSKALPELEKLGFVKIMKNKESGRFSIELNRDNHKVIWLKKVDNLKQLYESDFVQGLYDNFPGATVILFGSFSSGEDTINSDIDIAIIGVKKKNFDLSDFEKVLEREININYYGSWKLIHKNLKDNILNGIILKGAVDL